MSETEMEKRRRLLLEERDGIVSKSELRRVVSSLGHRMKHGQPSRTKIDIEENYVEVSVGKNVVYFSMTKLGAALTPRKAELIGLALIEAAKVVENKG